MTGKMSDFLAISLTQISHFPNFLKFDQRVIIFLLKHVVILQIYFVTNRLSP